MADPIYLCLYLSLERGAFEKGGKKEKDGQTTKATSALIHPVILKGETQVNSYMSSVCLYNAPRLLPPWLFHSINPHLSLLLKTTSHCVWILRVSNWLKLI